MKLLPLCFLGTATFAQKASKINISSSHGLNFVDEEGRTRIFHGYNVQYKNYPYLPERDDFDAGYSLTTEDIDNLVNWGAKVVRLGVMWEAVEYEIGDYEDKYLSKVERLINELGKKGINTIVDSHQNLFSSDTCGNGVPPAYLMKSDLGLQDTCNPEWEDDMISTYFTQCANLFDFDGVTLDEKYNLVDLPSCQQQKLNLLYSSAQVRKGFGDFYDDVQGLFGAYLDYWDHVSDYFDGNDYVIGYDILNEPWAPYVEETDTQEELPT
jgi:endoglycosylceramidase